MVMFRDLWRGHPVNHFAPEFFGDGGLELGPGHPVLRA